MEKRDDSVPCICGHLEVDHGEEGCWIKGCYCVEFALETEVDNPEDSVEDEIKDFGE